MSDKTQNITAEVKDFVMAKGDGDATEREYKNGEKIVIDKREYRIITEENIQKNKKVKDGVQKEYEFPGSDSGVLFKDLDFQNVKFISGSYLTDNIFINIQFKDSNLEGVNFSGSIFENIDFTDANLEAVNFNSAKFRNIKMVGAKNIPFLTEEQKKEIIFTEKEAELLEENKEQKAILEETSEKQTKKLQKSFIGLEESFAREEKLWLSVSFISFLFLLLIPTTLVGIYLKIENALLEKYIISFLLIMIGISLLSFIFYFMNKSLEEKPKEVWCDVKDKSALRKVFFVFDIIVDILSGLGIFFIIFSIGILSIVGGIIYLFFKNSFGLFEHLPNITQASDTYFFLPLLIILFSLLYFSVSQYSRAKKLRIENQTKVALISGYQALRINSPDEKQYFVPNFANVIFQEPFDKKDFSALPWDVLKDTASNILKK